MRISSLDDATARPRSDFWIAKYCPQNKGLGGKPPVGFGGAQVSLLFADARDMKFALALVGPLSMVLGLVAVVLLSTISHSFIVNQSLFYTDRSNPSTSNQPTSKMKAFSLLVLALSALLATAAPIPQDDGSVNLDGFTGVDPSTTVGGDSNIPSSTDDIPSSTDNIPSSTDDVPSFTDNVPSFTEDVPSSTDNVPSSTDDIPSSTDNVPSSTDDVPSTTDNVPNSTDNVPSSTDDMTPPPEAEVQPTVQGDQPEQPDQGAEQPTQPDQGTVQPDQGTEQPAQPDQGAVQPDQGVDGEGIMEGKRAATVMEMQRKAAVLEGNEGGEGDRRSGRATFHSTIDSRDISRSQPHPSTSIRRSLPVFECISDAWAKGARGTGGGVR
ncbi:MAG: hypothetical protein M1829_006302 [Trizodia sp. TS-e1964]|nr:MAG: hypothetical protein M1829_006302 [Trizodia sp. TS-e1964]